MQPDLFDSPAPAPKPRDERTAALYRDLVKLGDMLGDGMGDEPDGKWIRDEYRRVAKALGHCPPRRNRGAAIDVAVSKHLETNRCECGGLFKQTRSGSLRVFCTACCTKYRLRESKPAKAR